MQPSSQPSSNPTVGAVGGVWALTISSEVDAPMDEASARAACAPSQWGYASSVSCNFRAALIYCLALVPWDTPGVTGCDVNMKENANISLSAGPLVISSSSTNPVKVNINGNGGNIHASVFGGRFMMMSTESSSNSSNSSTSHHQSRRRLASTSHLVVVLSNLTISGFGSNSTDGGAVEFRDLYSVSISDVSFVSNRGSSGGAVFVKNASFVSLKNVIFSRNEATNGGALFLQNIQRVSMSNTQFTNNRASNIAGAVVLHSASSASIENSVFKGNSAVRFGGSLSLYDVKGLQVTNNAFVGNNAQYGSAIAFRSSSNATYERNKFTANEAYLGGGTVYWIQGTASTSGGLSAAAGAWPLFSENVFSGNRVASVLNKLDIASDATRLVSSPSSLVLQDYTSIGALKNVISVMDNYNQVLFAERNATVTNAIASLGDDTSCSYNTQSVKLAGQLTTAVVSGKASFSSSGGWSGTCIPGGHVNVTMSTQLLSSPVIFPDYMYDASVVERQGGKYTRLVTGRVLVAFRKCDVGEFYDFFATKSLCIKCSNSYSFVPNNDNRCVGSFIFFLCLPFSSS